MNVNPKPYTPLSIWNMAFALVVVAGYAVLFSTGDLDRSQQLTALLLGVTYLVLGTVVFDRINQENKPLQIGLYFVVQFILVAGILRLGEGNAWLIAMPLVSHAVVLLPRWQTIIVCAGIILLQTFPVIGRQPLVTLIQFSLPVSAAVFFVAVMTSMTMSEERARREVERLAGELGEANQKLRQYAAQVEELAVAQERNRLAREIHDGLGHYLTSINMQIKAAQAVLAKDPTRAVDALGKAQTLAEEALVDVRRSVSALRLSPVEGRSLSEAISELVAESQAAGIPTRLEVRGTPRSLPLQIELALFRTAQEGLTNVRKHAQGANAQVSLDYASSGRVLLTVEDDGQGVRLDLAPSAQPGAEDTAPRFGLLGLKERAQLLGGRLTAENIPGGGFRLAIDLPDDLELKP